jgi:hypothetical protein
VDGGVESHFRKVPQVTLVFIPRDRHVSTPFVKSIVVVR